jgi:hypothetical protein
VKSKRPQDNADSDAASDAADSEDELSDSDSDNIFSGKCYHMGSAYIR